MRFSVTKYIATLMYENLAAVTTVPTVGKVWLFQIKS